MVERTVRTEKNVRGPFGQFCKWVFIAFNGIMLFWMISTFANVGSAASGATSDAARVGVGIGATIGFGLILTLWAFGDIILGMFVLFTRGKRVVVEERHLS